MHFTEGKDLEYERLMQQKPGFDRQPNKFAAPRGNGDAPAACIGMHRRKMRHCNLPIFSQIARAKGGVCPLFLPNGRCDFPLPPQPLTLDYQPRKNKYQPENEKLHVQGTLGGV